MIDRLKELNNYVKVEIAAADLGIDLFKNYDVVVFTEVPTTLDDIVQWNQEMRAQNIGTIVSQSLGLYGYTFCDFGDNFQIFDEDGERTNSFIVQSIEKVTDVKEGEDPHLIVRIHDEHGKRHTFHDKSHVVFTEVEGAVELNDMEPLPVQTIDGFSFKVITDPTKIGEYTKEGIVEDKKVPRPHKFNSLRNVLDKPLETA